jgi:flagellar biosynthesis protein FlhF
MSAQRFVASNATDALRRIKAELGGDAVVLSSREVPEGVEILAIAAVDLVTLAPQQPQPPARAQANPPADPPGRQPDALPTPPQRPRRQLGSTGNGTGNGGPAAVPPARRAPDPLSPPRQPVREPLHMRASGFMAGGGHLPSPTPRFTPMPAPLADGLLPLPASPVVTVPAAMSQAGSTSGMQSLSSQMAEVKSLLSGHLASSFWTSLQQAAPGHALLTRRLLNAGLSSQVVTQLLADMPTTADLDGLLERAQRWIQGRLETRDAFDLFDKGGVYAFIGPTGVGKTTTLAKIAARCVLRYGRRQVALMTTDTYRIGAQEQLRVFARILNLPVVSLRDSEDLESKVADLSARKIVLLDTAGVGQRDAMMVEQLEMIRQGCGAVHRVLVMSATTSTRTLDDVVAAHRNALGGHGIHSAILTKIDEGMSLAPAIDCVLRHRLPLLFLSNGQRVPEDLFAADAAYIAHRTVNPRGRDDSATDDAHMPAMIADDINAWTTEARSA